MLNYPPISRVYSGILTNMKKNIIKNNTSLFTLWQKRTNGEKIDGEKMGFTHLWWFFFISSLKFYVYFMSFPYHTSAKVKNGSQYEEFNINNKFRNPKCATLCLSLTNNWYWGIQTLLQSRKEEAKKKFKQNSISINKVVRRNLFVEEV